MGSIILLIGSFIVVVDEISNISFNSFKQCDVDNDEISRLQVYIWQ